MMTLDLYCYKQRKLKILIYSQKEDGPQLIFYRKFLPSKEYSLFRNLDMNDEKGEKKRKEEGVVLVKRGS